MVKNLAAIQESGFDLWVRKITWRREWLPTPVFLPREFHEQRGLGVTVHGVAKTWTQQSNKYVKRYVEHIF